MRSICRDGVRVSSAREVRDMVEGRFSCKEEDGGECALLRADWLLFSGGTGGSSMEDQRAEREKRERDL